MMTRSLLWWHRSMGFWGVDSVLPATQQCPLRCSDCRRNCCYREGHPRAHRCLRCARQHHIEGKGARFYEPGPEMPDVPEPKRSRRTPPERESGRATGSNGSASRPGGAGAGSSGSSTDTGSSRNVVIDLDPEPPVAKGSSGNVVIDLDPERFSSLGSHAGTSTSSAAPHVPVTDSPPPGPPGPGWTRYWDDICRTHWHRYEGPEGVYISCRGSPPVRIKPEECDNATECTSPVASSAAAVTKDHDGDASTPDTACAPSHTTVGDAPDRVSSRKRGH